MSKLLDFLTLKALKERRVKALSQEEHHAELQEINNAYFRVFNSTDGKFVLEHMVKTQLTGSIAMQGDDLLNIGEKQGRANLVKEIIQRVEVARIS